MYLRRDSRNCRLAKARTICSETSRDEYFLFPETAQLTEYHWKKIPEIKLIWFWNL